MMGSESLSAARPPVTLPAVCRCDGNPSGGSCMYPDCQLNHHASTDMEALQWAVRAVSVIYGYDSRMAPWVRKAEVALTRIERDLNHAYGFYRETTEGRP